MSLLTRLAFVAALTCLLSARGFAQANDQNGQFWRMHDGWGHMTFGGGIGMIVFWGATIVLIVFVVRAISGGLASRSRTPLEILQERYAKGEISKEEYEERRKTLSD